MKRGGEPRCPLEPAAGHATAPPPRAAAGRQLWAHRRRALVAAALAWLALGLAGGLVQHAPQGWTIPVLTCCSHLALALAGVLGATATATVFDLADVGLPVAGGLLGLGLAWQASTETSSPGVAAHPQGDAGPPHRTRTGGCG